MSTTTAPTINFDNLTEDQERQIGEEIARVLHLKEARHPETRKRYTPARYETTHGSKTALGLARTLAGVFLQVSGQQNPNA